jgi:hypothetical protein
MKKLMMILTEPKRKTEPGREREGPHARKGRSRSCIGIER